MQFTVKAKKHTGPGPKSDDENIVMEVHAKSNKEACKLAEQRHDYRLYDIHAAPVGGHRYGFK